MAWYNHNFISLDTETTGLDWNDDRVIQLGVTLFQDGKAFSVHEWLINANRPSCDEAVRVHCITDELQKTGEAPLKVLLNLRTLIMYTGFIVIMNAPFDLNFIIAEFARYGMKIDIPYIIDPLVISRFYEKNRIPSLARGRRTLKAISERYGITDYPLHSAGHDSQRVGELAIEMGQRHGQLGRSPIAELHKKQRIWHNQWSDDFASFADTKGFSFRKVEWPHEKAGEQWPNQDPLPLTS